jgi:integrase
MEAVVASISSYRTPSGTRFIARIRLKGLSEISRTFDTRRHAREWADTEEKSLRTQRDRGGLRTDATTITVRQLTERFLSDPKVRQLKYLPDLALLAGAWADEFADLPARSFSRIQVVAFRDKLLANGLSPARVNRYLSAMRRCWNWAIDNGFALPSSPWPRKVAMEEPKPLDVLATPSEVGEIFAACDVVSLDLGSLVRFLVGTGARLSDALAVTWRDIDLERGDVAVRGQKTGKPLRVAMLAPAIEGVRQAAKVRQVRGRVFWQFADRMAPRSSWRRARKEFPEHLRQMRLHDCRHLCASLLAANGATDIELAAQLGHSTLQMVKRYSHLRGGHRGTAHERLDKSFLRG